MEENEQKALIDNFKINFNETGDPFVDAGGMALEYISCQFPDKSILELIEWATDIYVNRWKKNLYNVFHTNAVKKIGTEKLKKFFEAIVIGNEFESNGYCRTCGKETVLYSQTREFYPISGSGTLVNFHHSHQNGILLCPQCNINLFFLPFSILRIGKNLAIINGGEESQKYWKEVSIVSNLDKIGKNSSTEILHFKFNKLIVAFFAFVTDTIQYNSEYENNESVTLYEFNNFGSEPYMNIINMDSNVIKFIKRTLKNCSKVWFQFLSTHYKYLKWNKEREQWIFGKDEKVVEPEKYYIDSDNQILNELLEGKSIFREIVKYYKKQISKSQELDSRMAVYYAREVIKMTSEQINLIKSIGNKIFDLMKAENDFKKYLVKLEGSTKAYQLRSALINIVKKNYSSGNDEAIVTLDEWVSYLFPDGQYWGEVRDMLLIFLYEKMHENNMQIEIEENEDIKETEDNNTQF